jgi:hypothetical protein
MIPRFLTVLGTIPIALTLAQRGILTVEQAAMLLILVAIAMLVVGSITKLLLPLFSIALFITYNTSSDEQLVIALAHVVALAMALFGIYVMLSGLFGVRGKDG